MSASFIVLFEYVKFIVRKMFTWRELLDKFKFQIELSDHFYGNDSIPKMPNLASK